MRRRALLTTPLLAAPALAQPAWPNRPIRAVIPYTPGGATDAMSRLAAQKLSERLGVPVVPENRAGGSGTVGGVAVAGALPDGHTILLTASIHVMARGVLKSVPYDPVADFTPIARTGQGPLLLLTNPGRAEADIPAVIAAARREPARWSFGLSSLGAAGHLASIEFNRLAGLDIPMVPYRGSAPALADIAAGNVQLMLDPILAALPLARGGQARALAITRATRSPIAPEIPTAAEAGMPGLEFFSWYGVWGPRGLPGEIVARMNAALREGLAEPAVVQRLAELGFEPVQESPAEFAAYIAADLARNTALLRAANFQPE
ncbi:tripartite tricarboxylate transporter substrate binding protein [Belnapia sp. T6]|uniref:Tripartite tricarboxylate transporter substrate binding protein n=1 Tax=Belnapia mucosa TaxID=2804532 RepID=A0ABS1V5Y4_9PROT|nr:tripartite tricarboxylate transporter substrate binding protein [Belnapia mucosa]MBL6456546.1 tripartite tricarboxylate transporter substrate binding protein [Belnapia mucosa]